MKILRPSQKYTSLLGLESSYYTGKNIYFRNSLLPIFWGSITKTLFFTWAKYRCVSLLGYPKSVTMKTKSKRLLQVLSQLHTGMERNTEHYPS